MKRTLNTQNVVRPSGVWKVKWVCGQEDVEKDEEDKEEFGMRQMKRVQDPRTPSKEEREDHEKTHLPFRSWCRHCVRGRGKQLPHREGAQETTTDEIHMDFGFLGKEDEAQKTIPILVVKERKSKMLMAAAVPTKTTGSYITKRVVGFLREIGCLYSDLIVKTDQEPAVKSIVEGVGKAKAADGSGKYIVENSPVGASQSNGVVERGIQSIMALARVLLSAVQAKWGLEVPIEHPFLCYLVEYAAVLLNRFEVGADGKTNYERNKGKKATTLGLELGEAVLWRRKKIGGALGKLTTLWEDGVYLGIMGKSGEIIIGDGKGVWKTRSVHRKPAGDRWDPSSIDLVRHPPWRTSDEDPNMDGEMPEVMKMVMTEVERENLKEELTVPKRVYLTKDDFEKFGYSGKCQGCKSILKNATRQSHSEACRKRLEKELEGTERSTKAKQREHKFFEETLNNENVKMKKDTVDDNNDIYDKNVEENKNEEMTDARGSGMGDETRKRTMDETRAGEAKSRRILNDEEGENKREREEDDHEDEMQPKKKAMVGGLEVNQDEEEESYASGDWHFPAEVEKGNDGLQKIMEFRSSCFLGPEYADGMVDDKTGEELDPRLVKIAEDEEMKYMDELGVGEEVEERECWETLGKAPVTTKFVRVNKGTADDPNVRARLVARDFKAKGDDGRVDLFAAMPPLEAKKMLFRMAAKDKLVWRAGRWQRRKLLFIDVKKAHLNGRVPEDTFAYVRLPDGRVWRLRRWLYGMRPAAQAWEEDLSNKLESIGFKRGRSASTVFYRQKTGCRCVVHGDDFTFLCYDDLAKKMVEEMKEWYDLKVKAIIGDDDEDDKEVVILNRTLRHTGDGIEYYADEKHEAEIRSEFGIEPGSNGLESPVEKEDIKQDFDEEHDDPEMDVQQAKKYRAVAARGNYLSLDRMDLQFAAKESCRQMARPRASGAARMKRVARYLSKYPKLVWHFGRGHDLEDIIDVYSDSDWAGCRRTRRSTSGGVATIDGCTVKHWSSTQGSVALSVGEAEYYALIKAAAEGLGLVALGKDMGFEFRLRVHVDSNTAKAITSRLGLGKVRHMEVKYLWAQEGYRKKLFEIMKVAGEKNPADVLTKPLTASEMAPKLASVGGRFVDSRARWCESHGSWADITDREHLGQ